MKHKKQSRRILSFALSAVMIFGMLPMSAFATEGTETLVLPVQEQCACAILCTDDSISTDCLVCSAEDADLTACKGEVATEEAAYDKVVELFTALPDASVITEETTEDEKDELFAQLTGAMDAFDALTAEEQDLFLAEQGALYNAAMALNDAITGASAAPLATGDGKTEGTPIMVPTWKGLYDTLPQSPSDTTYKEPVYFKLANDVVAQPDDSSLEIEGYTQVYIDLNGFSLDRGLSDSPSARNAYVVKAFGKLTVSDSSPNETGTITGGNGSLGGGVAVQGARNGDPAGEFTLNSGTITGNECSAQGAGIYMDYGAKVNLNGGAITGNTVRNDKSKPVPNFNTVAGGGIYARTIPEYTKSIITVSGSPVVENNKVIFGDLYEEENNINLENTFIDVGALTAGAKLGITTYENAVSNITKNEVDDNAAQYFFSDKALKTNGNQPYKVIKGTGFVAEMMGYTNLLINVQYGTLASNTTDAQDSGYRNSDRGFSAFGEEKVTNFNLLPTYLDPIIEKGFKVTDYTFKWYNDKDEALSPENAPCKLEYKFLTGSGYGDVGVADLKMTSSKTAPAGNYSLYVTASNGTKSHSNYSINYEITKPKAPDDPYKKTLALNVSDQGGKGLKFELPKLPEGIDPEELEAEVTGDSGPLIDIGSMAVSYDGETQMGYLKFDAQESNTGTNATIEITVGESTLYLPYKITCTVTSSAKKMVKFDARNGATIADAEVDEATGKITMPADPTWEDYKFDGWYTGKDGTSEAFENSELTASTTLYAKWTNGGKQVYTMPLDFSAATGDMKGDGYVWNNGTKTLTLSGTNIRNPEDTIAVGSENVTYGIRLPNGATIDLTNGTVNTISGGNAYPAAFKGNETSVGVWVTGSGEKQTLTIQGSGTLFARGGEAEGTSPSSWGIKSRDHVNITGGTIHAIGGNAIGSGTRPETNSVGMNAGSLTIGGNAVVKAIGASATATGGDASRYSGYARSYGTSSQSLKLNGGTLDASGGAAVHTPDEGKTKEEKSVGINAWDEIAMTGGTASASGKTYAVFTTNPYVITADGAMITGANETFTSGETETLTQKEQGTPVVISFTPTISFDARNGATIADVEVDEATGTITMPANPTWGEYTFGGWYTDKDYTTAFANKDLTGSATVYAKWTNGGKTVVTETLDLSDKETTDKLSTEGWAWNNETKTLTLSGLTLGKTVMNPEDDGNAYGIILPEDVASTIILTDGTENTIDVSRVVNPSFSAAITSYDGLTIKTSGKGTPGKLNAISGKADSTSVGIFGDDVTIESGVIVATGGETTEASSSGIATDYGKIHIKGGTVTATGGKSDGSGMSGSFGLFGMQIQIDDGIVKATGGEATLSAGIVGAMGVAFNGGTINAEGFVAAVASLSKEITGDDLSGATVNGKAAAVKNKNIGLEVSTFVDGETGDIIKDAAIRFKTSHVGTNPLAPSAAGSVTTDTTVTLNTQTVKDETVEYGVKKSDGTIAWQDSPAFIGLTPNTEYTFYARVKANADHKSGTTSAGTDIRTKTVPQGVSGKVTDSSDAPVDKAEVELKQGNELIRGITTDVNGTYSFEGVPAGVYSLIVTRGTAPNTVTITSTITVDGAAVTANMQFLDGNKNTVVETTNGTPNTTADGMNTLLNDTNISTTLTSAEKTVVDDSGSVVIKVKADEKTGSEVAGDKSKIEAIAAGKKIGTLLDLSVLKTVKDKDGKIITDGEKLSTLASLIEVTVEIPTAFVGKPGLTVYRVHGDAAQELSTTPDINGEYYEISADETYLMLHVKNFSTYAFGYTVNSVTITEGGSGASGAGSYGQDDIVTINAGTKSGYIFSGWTVSPDVTFANAGSASTSFVMPNNAVKLTANWTYNGGGGSTGGGSSSGGGGSTNYPNTVSKPENGTVSMNPTSPTKGQTVTITTMPDKGYEVDQVIVKDAKGKTIVVTEKDTNSFTFIQPAGKVTVEVTYKVVGTSGETDVTGGSSFTDVTANDWFYDAVMEATANGWFSGTSETTFSPNTSTSRGMIATILHRIEGTPSAAAASFDDVASDAYYANGIAWAQANGVVTGYGNGSYGPNDNITREQLASILHRYAKYKGYDVGKTTALDGFTDSESVSSYAKEAMSWAVASGLVSGRGNNTLAPTASATRAEVASILIRFEELRLK